MSGSNHEILSLSLADRVKPAPRSDHQPREYTLAVVADLYCRGLKQYEIAETIGVHPTTVSAMIKDVREAWMEAQLESFDMRVSQELAKIDHVEREAWAAWDRSIGIIPTETTKQSDGPDADGAHVTRTEVTLREATSAGNPKFLDIVDKCIARRVDLLGLKAPTRKQVHMKIEQKVESLAERLGLDPVELKEYAGKWAAVLGEE